MRVRPALPAVGARVSLVLLLTGCLLAVLVPLFRLVPTAADGDAAAAAAGLPRSLLAAAADETGLDVLSVSDIAAEQQARIEAAAPVASDVPFQPLVLSVPFAAPTPPLAVSPLRPDWEVVAGSFNASAATLPTGVENVNARRAELAAAEADLRRAAVLRDSAERLAADTAAVAVIATDRSAAAHTAAKVAADTAAVAAVDAYVHLSDVSASPTHAALARLLGDEVAAEAAEASRRAEAATDLAAVSEAESIVAAQLWRSYQVSADTAALAAKTAAGLLAVSEAELAAIQRDMSVRAGQLRSLLAVAAPSADLTSAALLNRPSGPASLGPLSSMTAGIPTVAIDAYLRATAAVAQSDPSCGLTWWQLAGFGAVESHHGTYGGASLAQSGVVSPPVIGIALDGTGGTALIYDTDSGVLDGDTVFDRAVGPMQFIPSTWRFWALDGSGDGFADPQNYYDATLAAARYLCGHRTGPISQEPSFRSAAWAYNQSVSYANQVIAEGLRIRAQLEPVLWPPSPPVLTPPTTSPAASVPSVPDR